MENTKHLCGIGMALNLKLTNISSFQYLDIDLSSLPLDTEKEHKICSLDLEQAEVCFQIDFNHVIIKVLDPLQLKLSGHKICPHAYIHQSL